MKKRKKRKTIVWIVKNQKKQRCRGRKARGKEYIKEKKKKRKRVKSEIGKIKYKAGKRH